MESSTSFSFEKLMETLKGLSDEEIVKLFESQPELAEQYAVLEKLVLQSQANFGVPEDEKK